MSSEFLPINMTRRINTEDTAYLRQNQSGNYSKAAKVAETFSSFIPSNEDIKANVETALKMVARNVYPDRGSILNIVV